MPETRDKRRKSDLDLFVLALISTGVTTPYELQKEAGLSPGATIPAIQRLLQAGLIRRESPGVRGRTDSRITAFGKKQLKSAWRLLLDDGASGDLDADLRVALLAISQGNAYASAVHLLRQSADMLIEIEQPAVADTKSNVSSLASLYRELRSISVRAVLEGQAAAAATIADNLPRKLSGIPKLPSNTSRGAAPRRRVKRLK